MSTYWALYYCQIFPGVQKSWPGKALMLNKVSKVILSLYGRPKITQFHLKMPIYWLLPPCFRPNGLFYSNKIFLPIKILVLVILTALLYSTKTHTYMFGRVFWGLAEYRPYRFGPKMHIHGLESPPQVCIWVFTEYAIVCTCISCSCEMHFSQGWL